MAYLTLSGIEVRCSASKGLTQKPTLLGPRVRTFSGWAMSGTRARINTWSAGTPPLPMAEAQSLRRLIDGEGHSWAFASAPVNAFGSSKGAVPSLLTGVPQAGTDISGRWGQGAMYLNPNEEVTWALGTRANATVGCWVRGPYIGPDWKHVALLFGPDELYTNGSELGIVDDLDSEVGLVISVSGGALKVRATADDIAVSDLVYLPYTMPRAWVPQWAAATAPFGPLPYHRADGTGIPEACRMLGTAGDAAAVEYDEDGARVQGQYLDFELWQLPEGT